MDEQTDSGPVVLVTGGAGYIGSHACKALAIAGYTPVTFDNLERGHRELVKWGPLEVGDLRDPPRLNEVMNAWNPIAVMHFAALAYVGESVEKPDLYFDNNVTGCQNLLDAMEASACDTLIFSSTCATYGEPKEVPIAESHPQSPVNPYGETKLLAEKAIMAKSAKTGLRYALLRYFNAAGCDPEGETGEFHDPETHLIPLAIGAAMGQGCLEIYGNDYATPDGTCIRDYIHVTDLVDAHIRAMHYLQQSGQSQAFNLGNGEGFSVRQIIDSVERVTGKQVNPTISKRRPGDPPILVGDASRAKRELGWNPQFRNIDNVIKTAISKEILNFSGH